MISEGFTQYDLDGNKLEELYYEWFSLEDIKREILERSKTCRDCGFLYDEDPFERGKYIGDDEPTCYFHRPHLNLSLNGS